MKTPKIVGLSFFSLLILIVILLLISDAKLKAGLKQIEFIQSPKGGNYVTLLLHNSSMGLSNRSQIYVIPGKYKEKEIPIDGNYIKLPENTDMDFEWLNDNTLKIYFRSGIMPLVNNFKSASLSIITVVDEERFKRLYSEGVKVRRINLNP